MNTARVMSMPNMNVKSRSLLVAAALCAGGCSTLPEGKTVEVQGSFPGEVVWEAMGTPRTVAMEREVAAPASQRAMTSHEFPGHPIAGVFVVAEPDRHAANGNGASGADAWFLRELAYTDGVIHTLPVETPSGTLAGR
jgi:hypothetical protein